MDQLTQQEIEALFKYLENPMSHEFPEELKKVSELELLGIQLMLQNLLEEKRHSQIH